MSTSNFRLRNLGPTLFAAMVLIQFQAYAQTLMAGMPAPNGSIYALEKYGNTIYMGGYFSQVNSLPHSGLARFDAITGTLDNWNHGTSANGLNCLAIAGTKLIAGGSFTEIDGQTRYGICMFNLVTGNLDPWSDTANFTSWRMGIGVDNNNFYFAKMPGFSFNCEVVCVNATTGNYTGWRADSLFNGSVNAIYASGNYVYVGGQFIFSGGSSVYDNLCRFDKATGALDLNWHPQPSVNNFGVTAIVKTNAELFVGGDFNMISGQSRKGVAAYDAAGNLTGFNQNSSSYEVLSLYGDGNFIWVGGNSSTLGGQLRYRIAQIRISNGSATCWNASATSNTWSTVQALLVSGDTVYVGPFGSPNLAVFNQSPVPLQGQAISGPDAVLPFQVANYSVPYVAGNTYAWTVNGGTGTSTTNTINITWGAGPTGSVHVSGNNPSAGNCSADTTLAVAISSSTKVDDARDQPIISILPNPSAGMFSVTTGLDAIEKLHVLDLCGREIRFLTSPSNAFSVDLSDRSPGIYFLQFETEKDSFTRKLVKE